MIYENQIRLYQVSGLVDVVLESLADFESFDALVVSENLGLLRGICDNPINERLIFVEKPTILSLLYRSRRRNSNHGD